MAKVKEEATTASATEDSSADAGDTSKKTAKQVVKDVESADDGDKLSALEPVDVEGAKAQRPPPPDDHWKNVSGADVIVTTPRRMKIGAGKTVPIVATLRRAILNQVGMYDTGKTIKDASTGKELPVMEPKLKLVKRADFRDPQ